MGSFMEKHVTVGIAGHVDHGKTSLVRCLTGIDTDRLKEEKHRGLSIESGIAPFKLESGTQIALVDVPGHTDFLKNTIRGLSSVDMALLVVAADTGDSSVSLFLSIWIRLDSLKELRKEGS